MSLALYYAAALVVWRLIWRAYENLLEAERTCVEVWEEDEWWSGKAEPAEFLGEIRTRRKAMAVGSWLGKEQIGGGGGKRSPEMTIALVIILLATLGWAPGPEDTPITQAQMNAMISRDDPDLKHLRYWPHLDTEYPSGYYIDNPPRGSSGSSSSGLSGSVQVQTVPAPTVQQQQAPPVAQQQALPVAQQQAPPVAQQQTQPNRVYESMDPCRQNNSCAAPQWQPWVLSSWHPADWFESMGQTLSLGTGCSVGTSSSCYKQKWNNKTVGAHGGWYKCSNTKWFTRNAVGGNVYAKDPVEPGGYDSNPCD